MCVCGALCCQKPLCVFGLYCWGVLWGSGSTFSLRVSCPTAPRLRHGPIECPHAPAPPCPAFQGLVPVQLPASHLNYPALVLFLVTSVWFGTMLPRTAVMSLFSVTSLLVPLPSAWRWPSPRPCGSKQEPLRWLQWALEGVRNALQTNFLSVIVLNSLLAIPASQVSACFKLFSPEASTAFFQIESHLFSTQVSNLSGALCIISQSALPRTIYPNLVSSVNYITMPFSSSSI